MFQGHSLSLFLYYTRAGEKKPLIWGHFCCICKSRWTGWADISCQAMRGSCIDSQYIPKVLSASDRKLRIGNDLPFDPGQKTSRIHSNLFFFTVGSVTFYTYLSSSLPDSLAALADQTKFIRVVNILLVPVFRVRLVFNLFSNASSLPAKIP